MDIVKPSYSMIGTCKFQSRILIKIKKSYFLFEESTIFKFPTFPEKMNVEVHRK